MGVRIIEVKDKSEDVDKCIWLYWYGLFCAAS